MARTRKDGMTYDEWRDTYSLHPLMNEAMAEAAWKGAIDTMRDELARLARFEDWLLDREGPLLHIDDVRKALE